MNDSQEMPPDEVMYVEICGGTLELDQDSLDVEDPDEFEDEPDEDD